MAANEMKAKSAQETSRALLQVSVAQICQLIGWNATQTSSMEILTDVLRRYMETLCKSIHQISEHAGRTEPNLDDVGRAFESVGINISELDDYVRHMDTVPFGHEQIVFPVPKPNNLQFPNPNSHEILYHREEHVHEHLPHMFQNMKDDVEQNSTLALTPQTPGQTNTPVEVTTPLANGEKRPSATASESPVLVKRPRVMASSLPEEAGHSQYEMSSITMTPDGSFAHTGRKGCLPDSRPPPPTIRHALTFTDATVTSKGVDGSEANKENAAMEPSGKEPPIRISVTTSKEGASINGGGNVKLDSALKTKTKKKDKVGVKETNKKQKKICNPVSDSSLKISLGKKRMRTDSGSMPPSKKPKLKILKTKEGKSKEGNLAKSVKIKKKFGPKSKLTPVTSSVTVDTDRPKVPLASDSMPDSKLKDMLLSDTKYNLGNLSEPGPSTSASKSKQELTFVPSPDSDVMLRQAFPPTDIFEDASCETSPQRLIIAEAEGRAQERAEEQRVRLMNIEETINYVIKESAAITDSKMKADAQKHEPQKSEDSSPRKRGRPKKIKPKDKIKSSEFIAEDVIKEEKADELGARNMDSINDTINSVIKQGTMSEESPLSPKTDAGSSSAFENSSTKSPLVKKPKKEGKKNKTDDKTPGVKKKLKDKIQHKADKVKPPQLSSPGPLSADMKPFVSDKFSTAEMKVFDFGAADSPPAFPERRPSQAEKEQSPVTGTPPSSQSSFPPVDIKKEDVSASSESTVTAPSSSSSSSFTASSMNTDQSAVLPVKIEIPTEKREGHKEKHKDKEYRKDKKEKRRDKEKKKKNKDKDRDRDRPRHEKHHHDRKPKVKEMISGSITQNTGLKIKIKFGSGGTGPSGSPPKAVMENKTQGESSSKEDVKSPSQRHELKLVIRRDASEGSSKQKHSSSVSKPAPASKSEPRNTPPTLHPASPIPGTPPPPVLSRNSSPVQDRSRSPSLRGPAVSRGRSPPSKASKREVFTFSSQLNSPPRNQTSASPPPRTPSPSRNFHSPTPKTPSPQRQQIPSSPVSVSSFQFSVSAGRKSPTPTPKTPSWSPSYTASSPAPRGQSPVRMKKSPDHIKPLFGTPERETSPESPLFSSAPVPDETIEPKGAGGPGPSLSSVLPKPKGKVGRPRSKSPRAPTSPKRKVPKFPKSANKTLKSPKAGGTGKSPGRGRPPKAKTLALRAALAAEKAAEKETPGKQKPNPKSPTQSPTETKQQSSVDEIPRFSPVADVEKGQRDSSPELSPLSLSMGFTANSSRQRDAVVAETVGSFIDATTGQQVWICPACKMQDDGTPMIGCDKCDDWYHWVCVNIIKEPPEEESWFCPRCSAKAKAVKPKGKRGRKKKLT